MMFSTTEKDEIDVEEAEVVVEGEESPQEFEHFTSQLDEESFQNWLSRGFAQEEKKKVGYQRKKRNAFVKLGYNPNHIPNQSKYNQIRKKRLDQWDNPVFNWPPKMPRPTMHVGKTLLGHLDSDERKRIEADRPYTMPDYRTGDVMKVTMFNSLSEGKF